MQEKPAYGVEEKVEPVPAAKKRRSTRALFLVYPAERLPLDTYDARCRLVIAQNKDQVSQRTGRPKHLINRVDDNEVARVLLAGGKYEDIS